MIKALGASPAIGLDETRLRAGSVASSKVQLRTWLSSCDDGPKVEVGRKAAGRVLAYPECGKR
jgi:hypothetical protein